MRRQTGFLTLASLGATLAIACGGVDDPRFYIGSTDEALCPKATTVEGIDVSEFQGTINWSQVKGSGRGFAIARVSDGTTHLDPTFSTNWSGIKSVGMVRGVYQFFRASEDPTAQANLLVQHVGKLGANELPAVADVEVSDGVSASTLVANLKTWLSVVESGTGKKPMIYTSPGLWSSIAGNSTAFGSYPLWVANWGVSCPSLPAGWSSFDAWQYADNGSVPGISGAVDLDKFNGSESDLTNFAGGAPYAAAYVSQSWPFATTTMMMVPGQVIQANIVLKNVGTKTWDSNTKLATTQPRDRSSPFYDSTWEAPNRLVAVTGTVPPGSTYKFAFDFHAPSMLGSYDEFYGMVEEGVAWFSDSGQGGPPDNQIEAKIDVVQADWAGQFVAQSFPPSSMTLNIAQGDAVDGWFDLKNVGLQTWKAGTTKLAPTPRDMASPLADPSWLSPTRCSTVAADVAPGATGRFNCKLAGNTVGDYMATFTLVEESVTWFGDAPKGGGPADDGLLVHVVVGNAMPAGDGGTTTNKDGGGASSKDGPSPNAAEGGCGCAVAGRDASGAPLAFVCVLVGAALIVRRRRRWHG